ncbi:Hypothetical predicted protein [Octopus vulgaris]|uniref:Uncharacterized protein n=1 Tax=Octopus vulgaris TaxID=6645 RepID=A0AA36BAR8_OCTVU|nr:Hypothetical predicted protein [Octopus vulgaris]
MDELQKDYKQYTSLLRSLLFIHSLTALFHATQQDIVQNTVKKCVIKDIAALKDQDVIFHQKTILKQFYSYQN